MAQKGKDSPASETVNKFKQNPGLYIGSVLILILVTVTFVGGDLIGGRGSGQGGDLTFGYYDGVPINFVPGNMFAQYREQAIWMLQSQGANPDNYFFAYQVWRLAFEETVKHTAILQMVKRSNYLIPSEAVDRAVLQRPEYQDNGRFSQALYQRKGESARLVIWRQTHDELIKDMFNSDFLGLLKPSGEVDFIAGMSSPQRSFQLVYFKVDDYPDSEFLSYARENSELFDSIHLSKITISGEREAKKILASIKDGTSTFEDAARTQSQDSYADRGGDMGKSFSVDLNVEILNPLDRQTIFSLGRGELSDVIRSVDGWSFFRVEEELTHADFNDYAVMEKVRSYVRDAERGRMEDWAIAQADSFIVEVEDSGLLNASRWRNLAIHNFGPIPINYAGVDLFSTLESFTISGFSPEYVKTISRNEDFWKIAFSTQINTPSKPLVQGDNILVLIPVEQIENEEYSVENIASMYSSYWLDYITEQSLNQYFLHNGKLDNRFDDVYQRHLMPTGF